MSNQKVATLFWETRALPLGLVMTTTTTTTRQC